MSQLNLLIEAVKQTLNSTVEHFVEFITKRARGAVKIAESAEKKGGVSLLTAHHFKAKAAPYAKGKQWAEKSNVCDLLLKEYKTNFDKLKNIDNLTQTQFQQITGKLEVYGELYIKHKK